MAIDRTVVFIDQMKHKAVIHIRTELPKISIGAIQKRNEPHKPWKNLNPEQFMEEWSFMADIGDHSGQCAEVINPTKAQKKLIDFWVLHHMHKVWPEQIPILNRIIKEVEEEEIERRRKLYDELELEPSDEADETAIIRYIRDNLEYSNDDAYELLALARYCVLEAAEIQDIKYLEDHKYEVQGKNYLCGTEDELYDLALEKVRENKEWWIHDIKEDKTEDSLEDWAQGIIDKDGWAPIISADGSYEDIDFVTNHHSLCICEA